MKELTLYTPASFYLSTSKGELKMFRGQAFDTFKLMIAAVIAVAILGILLGILGGITPQVGDPGNLIKQQLGKGYQLPGIVYASQQKANFKAGTRIRSDAFSDVLGGTGEVKFYCNERLAAGSSPRCQVTGGTARSGISFTADFDEDIFVCCESDEL